MTIYLNISQALQTHQKTIEVSGGGACGFLDNGKGKLEAVLDHIKNDDYYPTFEEKLTHLFFCLCKFHCFQDGNKRAALTLSCQMLLFNGYLFCAKTFMQKMENIAVHVASGKIDKELLGEIIFALINLEDDDEALKLKILNAIQS